MFDCQLTRMWEEMKDETIITNETAMVTSVDYLMMNTSILIILIALNLCEVISAIPQNIFMIFLRALP